MKVSIELLNALMKTIRQVEKANSFYQWSPNSEIMKVHLLDNELYFSRKLNHENIKKFNYYEDKILNRDNTYDNLLKDMEIKIRHRDFSVGLISELEKNTYSQGFSLMTLEKYNKKAIDPLINAMQIFRDVYTSFSIDEQRYMFASTILNTFLLDLDKDHSRLYISEVIKSNSVLFQSSIMDEQKAIITLMRLLSAQLKKNNERIIATTQLINKYQGDLYNESIRNYMFKNPVFTISNFTDENNISYNTGKKYLKELVQREIISPVKISRNNAFIFNELYNIWIK